MTVFEKIEAQQKGKEESIVRVVGEQLKDICRSDPHCAEIVAADLENPEMSIEKAERKIKAWADQQKRVNNGVGVSTVVADRILREFYGLPAAGAKPEAPAAQQQSSSGHLDLDAFL